MKTQRITFPFTEEPLTGVHLHRSVKMNDCSGIERILETGYVTGGILTYCQLSILQNHFY